MNDNMRPFRGAIFYLKEIYMSLKMKKLPLLLERANDTSFKAILQTNVQSSAFNKATECFVCQEIFENRNPLFFVRDEGDASVVPTNK